MLLAQRTAQHVLNASLHTFLCHHNQNVISPVHLHILHKIVTANFATNAILIVNNAVSIMVRNLLPAQHACKERIFMVTYASISALTIQQFLMTFVCQQTVHKYKIVNYALT